MRILSSILLCLLPVFSFGEFPSININNLTGDYLDQKGTAHADKARYKISKVKIAHENIYIDFNKKVKNLVIKDDTTSVELDFDFSFLNVFKAFSFKQVQIQSTKNLFSLGGSNLDLYISKKKYHLSDYFIETNVKGFSRTANRDITLVDGLILNAGFGIKKIEFAKFDDVIFDDIRIENPEKIEEANQLERRGQSLEIPMIIRNADYKIHRGSFMGKAKIDSYINLWFRVWGDISSDKDNNFITIKIKKAKLGFFRITRTVLNMVKDLKLDGVKVSGNTITVDLRDVVSVK